MQEHDIVVTVCDIDREDEHVPAGSKGAIVSVYNSGEAYAVEFDNFIVVTVYPNEIKPCTPQKT